MAGPKKRSVGKPPKTEADLPYKIDELENLGSIHCTYQEIADYYKISIDTLERDRKRWGWIDEAIDRGRSEGERSLRRRQVDVAMEGNVPMLIFLGKNYLKQTDKVDHEHEHKGTINHGVLVVPGKVDHDDWSKGIIEHQKKIKEIK